MRPGKLLGTGDKENLLLELTVHREAKNPTHCPSEL